MPDSTSEVRAGERFAFGANWSSFLSLVDEERIDTAVRSLQEALAVDRLEGKSFLDIGCGSGLFSLAAHRLGARVHSFDFDAGSVDAAVALRERFARGSAWRIETGSILDTAYVASLGQHDVVYSWGVLHHTGQLWTALAAAADRVAPGGDLFVSIYNDQGRASRRWRRVKRQYNRSGRAGRLMLVGLSALYLGRHAPVRALARALRPGPAPQEKPAPRARGMSRRHDLVDWVGGYPFEVARPEQVFRFVRDRGFALSHLTTCGAGLGCNEYVFRRAAAGQEPAQRDSGGATEPGHLHGRDEPVTDR